MQPTFRVPSKRYAVVLNANAGRVTPRLARRVGRAVPRGSLHLTQSPAHARDVLRQCVEDEVDTVFAGGGDGTIVDVINTLSSFRADAPRLPSVGVLRLGTGNALAHWLGSGRPLHDLGRWQGGLIHRTLPVPMVESEDTLFPFAGLGHDAAVLNDYNWLKARAKGRWWQGLARGLPGYLMAGYLRTVPNYLRRSSVRCRVINLGQTAHRIARDGREVGKPIRCGETIYEGPCSMVATATTPFYGYGMKMFPHATRRPGRFQLRVLNMGALDAARNLIPCWKGTMQHPGLHDFYADRVRVVFEDAMPYQLGGEAKGYRREMTFGLGRFPVDMVAQA